MQATLNINSDNEMSDVLNSSNNNHNKTSLSDYEFLANNGDVDAQFQLGKMYENGHTVNHDYALSIRWYKKAAEQGHLEAQYTLGVLYKKGRGVPVDFSEAYRWYKQAAEQGMPQAQNNLACLYFYGLGVEVNFDKALYWYKKAAEQETPKSQYNLGLIYQNGLGVEPDLKEGLHWYQKAANKGYTEAIKKINILVDHDSQKVLSESVTKSNTDNTIEYVDATSYWLKEIAEQVSKTSNFKQESTLYTDKKVIDTKTDIPSNEIEMPVLTNEPYLQESVTEITWFIDAAKKGGAEAQYSLAVMYEYGLLVKQDYVESIFWYKKSANQGYAEAQNQLGEIYKNGIAINKDLVEAYCWFSLAKQSTKFSDINLASMEKIMTEEQILQANLKMAELLL